MQTHLPLVLGCDCEYGLCEDEGVGLEGVGAAAGLAWLPSLIPSCAAPVNPRSGAVSLSSRPLGFTRLCGAAACMISHESHILDRHVSNIHISQATELVCSADLTIVHT